MMTVYYIIYDFLKVLKSYKSSTIRTNCHRINFVLQRIHTFIPVNPIFMKPISILFILLVSTSGFSQAQTKEVSLTSSVADTSKTPRVYQFVERMPTPSFDIKEYLAANVKYPVLAQKKNIQGRVMVSFVVNEDGSIDEAKVLRGIGGGCDEEALRVIKNMPRWNPGKQNNKPVKVKYTQPISFVLR